MNQKLALLILIIALALVGCTSQNVPTKEVISATTAIIPSSTSLPIKTITPVPTATFINPTPTLYLTPLPTLSSEQSLIQLYKSENKCDVPCWWGIIPGVSTWTEAKQFIEHFNPSLSFGFDKVIVDVHITKSMSSDVYKWYVWPPASEGDTSISIFLEVQNNIVTAVKVGEGLTRYFFPVPKLLEVYGQPDQVLVYVSNYDSRTSMYNAFIYLIYDEKHALAVYHYLGVEGTVRVNLCLHEHSEQEMYLWAPGTELNMDFSKLKPLDEYSELNPKTFYDRFKDQNNKCLQISKDA